MLKDLLYRTQKIPKKQMYIHQIQTHSHSYKGLEQVLICHICCGKKQNQIHLQNPYTIVSTFFHLVTMILHLYILHHSTIHSQTSKHQLLNMISLSILSVFLPNLSPSTFFSHFLTCKFQDLFLFYNSRNHMPLCFSNIKIIVKINLDLGF